MFRFSVVVSLLLLCFSFTAQASHDRQLEKLMAKKQVPDGVVFEIISRRADYLDWAIPEVRRMSEMLRKKYPGISLAVVSHSREQFALATANQEKHKGMHAQVQSLVKDQDIPVHICGINAERQGMGQSDFPDYVDVAESGPIQLALYREMGYKLIIITRH